MKKIPEHLPFNLVLQLANRACEKYGFKTILRKELITMFTTKKVLPSVVRVNENSMLWVDKWYVAVQIDGGDVEYLYLTYHHINEELWSYRNLRKFRNDAPRLPADIVGQFRVAYNWMKPTEQRMYFSPTAETLGLNWVSVWRNTTHEKLQKLLYTIPTEKRSA